VTGELDRIWVYLEEDPLLGLTVTVTLYWLAWRLHARARFTSTKWRAPSRRWRWA